MAKTISFDFEGKTYTLEYNRKTVATLERQGFNPDDIETKPMLTLPAFFYGAFMANHPTVKRELVDKILSKLPNKMGMVTKLAEMYNETITTFIDDPEESEGNIEWRASW